jgi:hypothetical protein
MDMLPTLCAAMKRAGGDALVLRTGESPHVLTGSGRQNVARAILSANALEALVTQIFSDEGRQTLRESGQVLEEVTVSGGLLLSAWAERTPDQVTIELRECAPAPAGAAPAPEPKSRPLTRATTLSDDAAEAAETPQQWLEVSVGEAAEGVFDAVPSFAVTGDGFEQREAPVHEIAAAELDPLTESASGQYEELFLQVPPASADASRRLPNTTTRRTDASPRRTRTHDLDVRPPVVSESHERPLPAYEESTVNASPNLQFVEPPRPTVARREPADGAHRVGHARGLARGDRALSACRRDAARSCGGSARAADCRRRGQLALRGAGHGVQQRPLPRAGNWARTAR